MAPAHVDIHGGWGNHGMLHCFGKLSVRAFRRTILPHDPMAGVAMVTMRRLWLESHFVGRQEHMSEGLGLVFGCHDDIVLRGIRMARMPFMLSW